MSTRKQEQRQALRDRLEEALQSLYHNATPNHPMDADDDDYWPWFEDTARFEIEYMQSGGPYSHPRGEAGMHGHWWTHVKTPMDIARPTGMFHEPYNKPGEYPYVDQPSRNDYWVWASEYGKLYQYGRGGRTLAPANLMKRSGYGDEHPKHADDFADDSYADRVELIQVLESFNAYVRQWNAGVADLYHEERSMLADEALHEAEQELATAGYFA